MLAALLLAAALTTGTYDLAGAQAVVNDVNEHRALAHEAALVLDPLLTAIAMDRAADLINRHYFGHVSPDGTTVADALRARERRFLYAGENLASAQSVEAAEQGLWASPEHRDNMLQPHYKRVGIAVVRTSGQNDLVVQVFTD